MPSKADLGVEHLQITGVGHDQRVDLQHLHVLFGEGLVEQAHQLHALFDLLALQTQRKRDAAAVEALVAGGRIDGEAQDFLGCRGGDLLDVHAALGRADES